MTPPPDPDPGDYDDEDDDEPGCGLGAFEVSVTDPELLGVLYDHRGEVLAAMYDRRVIPFGFQRPASQPH